MTNPHILLLEDEPSLGKIVRESLEGIGFSVTHALDGRQGLSFILNTRFDLCIVDVMMPKLDGFSFVKELRKTDKEVPVIFLTAKTLSKDVVEGYKAGGNDYLRKPFSLEELILRIRELLRRRLPVASPAKLQSLTIGSYTFLPVQQELWHQQHLICKLSYRETELLQLLIDQKDQILERKACLLKLWGDDNFFNARTMDVYISKLRKYFSRDKSIEILNIRGIGYKLITDAFRQQSKPKEQL